MDTFTAHLPAANPDPDLDLGFEIVSNDDRVLAELSRIREGVVEKIDEISCRLEAQMNPSVAARLSGDEQKKAAHLFRSQAQKIQRELHKLAGLAESFRTHIY